MTSDNGYIYMESTEILKNLRGSSLVEQTSSLLINYIKAERSRPGEFLPSEIELCKKLGISRSTLREAEKILESKGLVKRLHGRGVQIVNESHQATSEMLQFMMQMNGTSTKELVEVRKIIEVQSVLLAAERATSEDIILMHEAINAMKSLGTSREDYINADLNFHLSIARATHNNVIYLIFNTIRPLLHSCIFRSVINNPRPEQSMHYHEKIFSCIRDKKGKQALEAMEEHLYASEQMIDY